MFGYATDLRSKTQGRATFTMRFLNYHAVSETQAKLVIDRLKTIDEG
jgi:elongation factor G